MCPSFYDLGGGAMVTPEQLNNRKSISKEEREYPVGDKKALIDGIINFRTALGESVSQSQKNRYQEMRVDQLEELFGTFRDRLAAAPKKTNPKEK